MTFRLELIDWVAARGKRGSEVRADSHLLDEGHVDSLLLTELLLFVETRIGRALTVEDLEPSAFRSIDAIVAAFPEARPEAAR